MKKCSNGLTFPCAGLEAPVIGEVHENVTLHCGNISGPRGLVTWYRNDSEPVFLLSSNSSFRPAEPRFSLANGSSLHIKALRLQDEGNYTCREVLNETRWFRVWLRVARKCGGGTLGSAGRALGALDWREEGFGADAWVSSLALLPARRVTSHAWISFSVKWGQKEFLRPGIPVKTRFWFI